MIGTVLFGSLDQAVGAEAEVGPAVAVVLVVVVVVVLVEAAPVAIGNSPIYFFNDGFIWQEKNLAF
jgi:hypothetical protein